MVSYQDMKKITTEELMNLFGKELSLLSTLGWQWTMNSDMDDLTSLLIEMGLLKYEQQSVQSGYYRISEKGRQWLAEFVGNV